MTKAAAIATLEYYKSDLFDVDKEGYINEEFAEALDMAIEALGREDTVAYICDGKACERGCSSGVGFCFHTTDVRHAVNFKEVSPGWFMEEYVTL